MDFLKRNNIKFEIMGKYLYSYRKNYNKYNFIISDRADYPSSYFFSHKPNKKYKFIIRLRGDPWYERKFPLSFFTNYISYSSCKNSDTILSVSNWLKKIIEKKVPKAKVNTLYNYVDLNRFKLYNNNNKKNVSFITNFYDADLLKMFIFSLPKYNKIKINFIIYCGSLKYQNERVTYNKITNIIKKNGLKNVFIKTGYYNTEDILKNTSVYFHPKGIESFSNVCLEAIACGIPVVTTNMGGHSEIVIDGYNGFLSNNVEEMIDNINSLLIDPRTYNFISKNGRSFAEEQFNIKKISNDFLTILESVEQ
jgi:glycosyltransferase involved in cell wall biosynthesis